MQPTAVLSRLLFADQFTVTVEETTPTLIVQANSHSRQTITFAGPTCNASINVPLSLQALQHSRAYAKPSRQFARINDPIAQMSKREPHGVLLRQLGDRCGAETDTTTVGENIRAVSSASDPNTEQGGRGERVPGSPLRPVEGAGPHEPDISAGADDPKLHHNQERDPWQ